MTAKSMAAVPRSTEESIRDARALTWFKLPAAVARECGAQRVALVALTAGEELMATKRADGDQVRLSYELIKQSIVRADDTLLSTADASADRFWERLGPVGRRLAGNAFQYLNNPKVADAEDFIASAVVEAG